MKIRANMDIRLLDKENLSKFRHWLIVSDSPRLIKLTLPDGKVFVARKETDG